VLGDATKPETYGGRLGAVEVLYQDVAQRDQAGIFLKNIEWVQNGGLGYLMVKARSEDMAASPPRIFEAAKRELVNAGLKILDFRILAPYQLDHAALVVEKP
jgi:fibrillarin-like pre-rRNA processing protein